MGKKVCLVGFGDVGRCIARKLLAFKLDIWVSDPAFSKSSTDGLIISGYGAGDMLISLETLQELQKCNFDNLNNCLENSNYIICCCPINNNNTV